MTGHCRNFELSARAQNLTPHASPFHLPDGQPLASESRSVVIWDPFLGSMRIRPLGARGRRGEGRPRLRKVRGINTLPLGAPGLSDRQDTCEPSSARGVRASADDAHVSRVTDKESSAAARPPSSFPAPPTSLPPSHRSGAGGPNMLKWGREGLGGLARVLPRHGSSRKREGGMQQGRHRA